MLIGLANLALRGPFQAGLLSATLLMFGLLVPPLIWLSAAVPALVFLRLGPLAGIRVLAIGTAAAGGFSLMALGQVFQALMTEAFFWLPACIMAAVLRHSVRLDWSLLASAAMAALLVLGVFGATGNPAEVWEQAMSTMLPVEQFASEAQVDPQQLQQGFAEMAKLMTGGLAATLMISSIIALFLARSWQARLFNPGGLRSEFHELRYGRVAAALATAVCALAIATANELLVNLAMVCLVLYLIQGLAIVHGSVALRGLGKGWLFGLYVLLVILMPHMMLLLGALGMADAWIDLRAKLGNSAS